MGNALLEAGDPEAAIANLDRAVSLNPGVAEIHVERGNALTEASQQTEAVRSYRRAISLKADLAPAYHRLGSALAELGEIGEAVTAHRRAIALDPDTEAHWSAFALSVERYSFETHDSGLNEDLLRLLDRPSIRPSDVLHPVLRGLGRDTRFRKCLEAVRNVSMHADIDIEVMCEKLSAVPLLIRIVKLAHIDSDELETLFSRLRCCLLQKILEDRTPHKGLTFVAALAHQCFLNEYVYFETEEEGLNVETFERNMIEQLNCGGKADPIAIACLACYRPLNSFAKADVLIDQSWPVEIEEILTLQIREPNEERQIQADIPQITPILDDVSRSVRAQYEENPYPRCVQIGYSPDSFRFWPGSV